MGERCPYPEFYEKIRSTSIAREAAPDPALPTLPTDDHGACIFHSQEVAWKRANDFPGKFIQLVQWLEADDEERKHYDFAEFLFVGSEIRTRNRSEEHVLRITDIKFRRQTYFTGATFLDSFELEGVEFQDGANFVDATFARDLKIENTRFRGLNFSDAKLAQLSFFIKVEFLSFALFQSVQFTGTTDGYATKFEDARFEGITDFSHASFGAESAVGFLRVQFEDFTNFREARFNGHVVFSDASFASVTEFIDTEFDMVGSAARYRGAAVELNGIEVQAGAVLTFMSTDLQNKMFRHDVQMSFKGNPAGQILFENVNLSRFTPDSKERLIQLAKSDRVEIGSGCIKYRLQTEVRTISLSKGNAPLILELCQTFTNYFMASNGINLGLEIVERDQVEVSFFYYTDEDISELDFRERLAQTEQCLWNLLSVRSGEHLLAFEEPAPAGTAVSTRRESALINAVDGVSAMLGTLFRVGVRIALGAWRETDTKALLGAIRFNNEGAEDRALSLHRVLVDRYTGRTLFDFVGQQNALLAPMDVTGRQRLTPGRVRILFLGANSSSSPLELDREVRKIQTSLKLAKEHDNLELKQEWAVTVETLMQAMLDESPTIVHFAGHGSESGILLQEDGGEPKVVSAEALSGLFKLFKDTVCCVVLSSCYSEHQARAIRRQIPYVIGIRSAIPDLAAVAFATGFYKALGAGKTIPFAFELGQASIRLEGFFDEGSLVLL